MSLLPQRLKGLAFGLPAAAAPQAWHLAHWERFATKKAGGTGASGRLAGR
jgi:hypothetical protein